MIINYPLHNYIRTRLLHLENILLFFVSFLSLRLAQVCVHYHEIYHIYPYYKLWLTMQACNLVHIHARLFTPCLPLEKYK
jgi:hypothetical protein